MTLGQKLYLAFSLIHVICVDKMFISYGFIFVFIIFKS